jgi:hypothetical protein
LSNSLCCMQYLMPACVAECQGHVGLQATMQNFNSHVTGF